MDLSGSRPFKRSQYYLALLSGDGSVKEVSGFLNGQLSNKRKIHVMNSSIAGVKQCVVDVVSALKQIWHAQVCATVGATATRTALQKQITRTALTRGHRSVSIKLLSKRVYTGVIR